MYIFFFYGYGDHRDLHVLTHSFPTRRSSDLNFLSIGVFTLARKIPRNKTVICFGTEKTPRHDAAGINEVFNEVVWIIYGVTDKVDRKSTRLNSSHSCASRMPSSA